MKRLILILLFVIYGFTLIGQTGPGWKYTPKLQSDILTISDYLRINLGVVKLNNPLEPGQVIQSRWVEGNLVFQNQAVELSDSLLKLLTGGLDTIYTADHPTLPIEFLMYRKDSLIHQVTAFQKPKGLFAGGVVTWIDSLKFTVSPAGYYINGKMYISNQTSLELSPSDPTYGRIDLIAVDSLSRVIIIEGIPAENPQKPIVDPSSELELTQVLILPNATTPGPPDVIRDEVIYDENTEWTPSTQGVTVNFAAQAPVVPFHGSLYASVGTIGMGDRVIFTSPEAVTKADYESLSLNIRLKATATNQNLLFVEFYLNGVMVSNSYPILFNHNDVTSWQSLSVALSSVTFILPTFNSVHLRWVKTGGGAEFTGFCLDYVKLQTGITQPLPLGEIILTGDVTGRGTGTIVTTVVNDSHTHTVATLPNIISSLDGVTNDGGNIDLIEGNNIQITPDDALNRITLGVTGLDTTDIAGLEQYITNMLTDITVDTTQVMGLEEYIINHLEEPNIDTSDVVGLEEFVLDRIPEPTEAYHLPKATTDTLGGVKIDGITIVMNTDSVISAIIPPAQQTILTGDVTGTGTGTINTQVTDDSHSHTTATLPNIISSLNGVVNDGGNIDLMTGTNIDITADDANNTILIGVSALDTMDISGLDKFVTDRIPETGGSPDINDGLLDWNEAASRYAPYPSKLGSDPGYPYFYAGLTDPTFTRALRLDGEMAATALSSILGNDFSSMTPSQVKVSSDYITGYNSQSMLTAYGFLNASTNGSNIHYLSMQREPSGYYPYLPRISSFSTPVGSSTRTYQPLYVDVSELIMENYGSGAVTGTPTYDLVVDSEGRIIESPITTSSGPNTSVQALSGTVVSWDVSNGINATLTLSGTTTITLSNLQAGISGNLTIINPATAHSLTFAGYTNKISPAVYQSANVVKTSGGSKIDCYSWYYDGTRLIWNGTLDYN